MEAVSYVNQKILLRLGGLFILFIFRYSLTLELVLVLTGNISEVLLSLILALGSRLTRLL